MFAAIGYFIPHFVCKSKDQETMRILIEEYEKNEIIIKSGTDGITEDKNADEDSLLSADGD